MPVVLGGKCRVSGKKSDRGMGFLWIKLRKLSEAFHIDVGLMDHEPGAKKGSESSVPWLA